MAMRRETGIQDDLVATWAEMPRSPGHAFYDRLQALLKEAGFDAFVEDLCKPYYAPRMGAPSLPPGRYFRMHMVGYFEGIDSERGICWRCSDSLASETGYAQAGIDTRLDESYAIEASCSNQGSGLGQASTIARLMRHRVAIGWARDEDPLLMQWTAPTTGIAMCQSAVAV